MKFLLPLLFSIPLFAGMFDKPEPLPKAKVITETTKYTIYCIEGYKVLQFINSTVGPMTQLMMDHNELVVPDNAKPYTLHSIAPIPCNLD